MKNIFKVLLALLVAFAVATPEEASAKRTNAAAGGGSAKKAGKKKSGSNNKGKAKARSGKTGTKTKSKKINYEVFYGKNETFVKVALVTGEHRCAHEAFGIEDPLVEVEKECRLTAEDGEVLAVENATFTLK